VAARAWGGGGGGGGPGRYFFTLGWIDLATEVPAVALSCMDGSIWWRRFRSLPTRRMQESIWRHIPASEADPARPSPYNGAEARRYGLGARAPVVLSRDDGAGVATVRRGVSVKSSA
jgi:hypothetical protein